MIYIGDYDSDRWMIITKKYKNGIMLAYDTFMLSEERSYEEMCEDVKVFKDEYIKENCKIKHPMKSVYILEYEDERFIIKAIKI